MPIVPNQVNETIIVSEMNENLLKCALFKNSPRTNTLNDDEQFAWSIFKQTTFDEVKEIPNIQAVVKIS